MIVDSTKRREIRKFGLIAFLFFGGLCAVGIWREKVVISFFFGVLFLLGIGFILLPDFLSPIYERWLKIAHFISRVVTTGMLALAYYLVITPTAFLKRLFGGRPLPVKPDKETVTYWVDRSEPAQPKERFFKRF